MVGKIISIAFTKFSKVIPLIEAAASNASRFGGKTIKLAHSVADDIAKTATKASGSINPDDANRVQDSIFQVGRYYKKVKDAATEANDKLATARGLYRDVVNSEDGVIDLTEAQAILIRAERLAQEANQEAERAQNTYSLLQTYATNAGIPVATAIVGYSMETQAAEENPSLLKTVATELGTSPNPDVSVATLNEVGFDHFGAGFLIESIAVNYVENANKRAIRDAEYAAEMNVDAFIGERRVEDELTLNAALRDSNLKAVFDATSQKEGPIKEKSSNQAWKKIEEQLTGNKNNFTPHISEEGEVCESIDPSFQTESVVAASPSTSVSFTTVG